MTSTFHIGKNHVFTNRTPDSEPYIYLKAGQGESLVMNGDITGNAATATTADTAGNVSGAVDEALSAESLQKTETIDSVVSGTESNISDPLPTGTPYKAYSVSVHNNDMFLTNPGDTRSSKQGTISYYKKVLGVWTYDSFFIPAFVVPSCTAHLQNWGYSISHRNNLMLVSSPNGPVCGTSIYKKTGSTWNNVSSTTMSGTHVHTDGTNGASWEVITNAEDVYICDSDGALVRVITTPTRDNRDAWVHNGQVAIACSSGHVYVYTISSGALVSTYSADNAFGYLVSMNSTYLVSVANDKRSVLIVRRSDGFYYGSFKFTSDIKQIKLDGSVLMIGFSDNCIFYYDNGIFFKTDATLNYLGRTDDTSPYASIVWPKVVDFDTTTSLTIVSGEPLTGSGRANYKSLVVQPTPVSYAGIYLFGYEMYVPTKEQRINITDFNMNPLNYDTCNFQVKGAGTQKLFTGLAKITDTTASTSVSTGSLINAGGFGNSGRTTTTDLTCINSIAGKNSYCICHTSSSTSLSSGVAFNAIFTSPTTINNGLSANSNGVITISETGTYLVSGYVIFASNSSGYRETFYQLSGGTYLGASIVGNITMPAINGASHTITSSIMMLLTANTTVSIIGYQNSGSSLNVSGHLSVTKITS